MPKKNILLLHGSSDLYGASKILLNTISVLQRSGHRVVVILSEEGSLTNELKLMEVDFKIIRLGIIRRKYFNLKGIVNRIVTLVKAEKKLAQIIAEEKINVIYSNTTAVLIGAIMAKKKRIKHIWHIHEIISKPLILVKLIGYFLKNATLVITVSNEVKNNWERIIGRKPANFITVYNGLNYQPYLKNNSELRNEINIPKNKLLIGMIGRVNSWKGQKYFIEIAAKLLELYSDLHFVMVGDAFKGQEYLYNEIEDLKTNLDVKNKITDLGYRLDVPNILSALDLFILPSILPDPFPTVILEAMASAIPIVATEHGGALEMIINNKTGIFIPPNNAEESANKIGSLIQQHNLSSLGLNGRERVLNVFSFECFEKNLLKAIASI